MGERGNSSARHASAASAICGGRPAQSRPLAVRAPRRYAATPMNSTPTSLVWLFDVDGTLLLTEGAGRLAISCALLDCFGIADDLAGIPMAGRTDPLIVGDLFRRHALPMDGIDMRSGFWLSVFAHMRRLMDPPRGGLLPGALDTLGALELEPAWVNALLTGNVTEMARIKLAAFGIYKRFAFGAFGDEAPDRNALAGVAVRRAAERCGVTPDRCVVVGDTEHDVACARAAGAKAVAVATGGVSRDRLARCEPDLLLDDLTDMGSLTRWGRSL